MEHFFVSSFSWTRCQILEWDISGDSSSEISYNLPSKFHLIKSHIENKNLLDGTFRQCCGAVWWDTSAIISSGKKNPDSHSENIILLWPGEIFLIRCWKANMFREKTVLNRNPLTSIVFQCSLMLPIDKVGSNTSLMSASLSTEVQMKIINNKSWLIHQTQVFFLPSPWLGNFRSHFQMLASDWSMLSAAFPANFQFCTALTVLKIECDRWHHPTSHHPTATVKWKIHLWPRNPEIPRSCWTSPHFKWRDVMWPHLLSDHVTRLRAELTSPHLRNSYQMSFKCFLNPAKFLQSQPSPPWIILLTPRACPVLPCPCLSCQVLVNRPTGAPSKSPSTRWNLTRAF